MDRSVGIVGGGMMGLATAFYLARRGVPVTVLERAMELGGLSSTAELLPGVSWDRYYHVVLSTDEALLGFLDELGLAGEVCFAETKTGFYTDGRLVSLSSTADFLKFPPISLWDKFRLGLGILWSSRIGDDRELEQIPVEDWLVRVFGRRNYRKLWEPLLRAKLGAASKEASAAFIWAIINRYYGTRHSASKKELMGWVRGGYRTVLARLRQRIEELGGQVRTGVAVQELRPRLGDGAGLELRCAGGERLAFDRVVATVPSPELLRCWPGAPDEFRAQLEQVRYLGLVCLTLLLRRPCSPYYVTNVTDPELPLTGVIETTALVPQQELGGHALLYLPRYLAPGDPFFAASDDEVRQGFLAALRRIHPTVTDDDVLAWAVHRERLVQPLQELRYSAKIPPMQTPLPGLWLANTTMIRNSTLNNNQVILLAKQVCELLG